MTKSFYLFCLKLVLWIVITFVNPKNEYGEVVHSRIKSWNLDLFVVFAAGEGLSIEARFWKNSKFGTSCTQTKIFSKSHNALFGGAVCFSPVWATTCLEMSEKIVNLIYTS